MAYAQSLNLPIQEFVTLLEETIFKPSLWRDNNHFIRSLLRIPYWWVYEHAIQT